ncbi:hypothetical protein L1987_18311 [Smallanthus sonchifolius]|uniref:Uncharacterized protein n=1 Tax=Smallanthus sonchifolius TaxID=185202 RepID=A0ACB9IZW9_9ASTR|nr:hypothetical protein L1987_18311 [Smallanthus sonchifolius]
MEPMIDVEPYLAVTSGNDCGDKALNLQLKTVCSKVSQTLREIGALVVKGPRCSAQQLDLVCQMKHLPNGRIAGNERNASPSSPKPHGSSDYQLSATHIELHRARDLIEDDMWEIRCMASSSDSSADESGYAVARLPFPRAAYMTGPEPVRTVDLNLPEHQHDHVLGKCPMWLLAESSGTKSDARTSSITKKDLKLAATGPRHENTVSAPMRL